MKRLFLQPNQIIVPGEVEIHDESILKIYFRIFERGHGEDMPPVLVAHPRIADMLLTHGELDGGSYNRGSDFYKRYNKTLLDAFKAGAEYFLLEGNHRSTAATLARKPISVLELQVDDDFQQLSRMAETGELFNWNIPGKNLKESMEELKHVLGIYSLNSRHTLPLTVKERVDYLVSVRSLPKYMVESYMGET